MLVEQSDMENAKEMFAGLSDDSFINMTNPKDEKDFDALATHLSKKLILFEVSFFI
jgi:hypothetical protein